MAFKDLSDEELMEIYQKGTYEAFQELYKRYSGRVYGYIKNKVRHEAMASDIFQEVFMKLHKSKQLYKNNLPFKPWLFTIAQSALIDEIRKNKKHTLSDFDLENLEDTKVAPKQDYDLSTHLEKLPGNQKDVLEMRYSEEKTFEEIAKILKTSESNVRQIVSRAIRNIKTLMRKGEDENV